MNLQDENPSTPTSEQAKREKNRRYYLENREVFLEKRRRYRAENPEKIREGKRRWGAANPEKVREMRRKYRANNIEKIRERHRSDYAKNAEKRRAWIRQYYIDNPDKRKAMDRGRREEIARRKALVDEMKVLKGCADCGYSDHPQVLEFDHLPGQPKVGNVATMLRSSPMEVVFAEMAKCEVVCANCHRIRTATRRATS